MTCTPCWQLFLTVSPTQSSYIALSIASTLIHVQDELNSSNKKQESFSFKSLMSAMGCHFNRSMQHMR